MWRQMFSRRAVVALLLATGTFAHPRPLQDLAEVPAEVSAEAPAEVYAEVPEIPEEQLDPIPLPRSYKSHPERTDAVREAFRHGWSGYYKNAFPHDELHPLSNGFGDSRNGWGASAIDALSTASVMGEKAIVNQIVDYVPKIQWQNTNTTVSLFETTIRYMGGLLSAYDFLSGPRADLVNNKANVQELLSQAKNLADHMKFSFKTKSGVPHNDIVFPNMYMDSPTNNLATVGTLILEWTRLTDLTGDSEYYTLADKAQQYLLNPKPARGEPFPGLLGTDISVDTGEIVNDSGSWSGGADSYYEYLIKAYVYHPERFGLYKDRFVAAAQSAMKYLRSEPRPGTVFLAQFNGRNTNNYSQHLTCFDGGTFILGGMELKRKDFVDFGLELVQGCRNTYAATATRIGPEQFSWDATSVPNDQKDFFAKFGFWINSSWYILRPEVLESMYYAYRATGDPKYQEWSWEAFQAINKTCRTSSGFTDISNVNAPDGGPKGDNQESFFFAEVLKYAYLIQAEEQDWQVQGPGKKQKWVFNTEAHPVRVLSR